MLLWIWFYFDPTLIEDKQDERMRVNRNESKQIIVLNQI